MIPVDLFAGFFLCFPLTFLQNTVTPGINDSRLSLIGAVITPFTTADINTQHASLFYFNTYQSKIRYVANFAKIRIKKYLDTCLN